MITFYFQGNNNDAYNYVAEKGMTWKEFIESNYNNGDFIAYTDTIFYHKNYHTYTIWVNNTTDCFLQSEIINNATYYVSFMHSGGGND